MKLWDAAPDTWLEVCSLFVSDSLTAMGDIEAVLNHTLERQAWQTMLVLAGEAHTLSDAFRSSILQRLEQNSNLWPNLDKRAMSAIARFGSAARPLLTRFMGEPSVETRRLAVYALGQSTEDWGKELLVTALTDPATQKSAAESLGGLGDDAIVLIEDLLKTRTGNPELEHACIEVAGTIGTAEALRAIMPLLWSDVAQHAALQIVHFLWQPEIRDALESGGLALSHPPDGTPDELADWAFPWLPEGEMVLRIYYARLVRVLLTSPAPDSSATLDVLPPDLLVPLLIAIGAPSRRRLAETPPVRPGTVPKTATVKPLRDLVIATVELAKRSDEKNRGLWLHVTAADKEDVILSYRMSRALWSAGMAILIGIVARGAMHGVLSWWWLGLPAAWIGIVVVLTISESDYVGLSLLGAPAVYLSRCLLNWRTVAGDEGWRSDDLWFVVGFSLYHLSLIACAVFVCLHLDGAWPWLACALLPSFLPTEAAKGVSAVDMRTVLYRRSNPLRRLRNALVQTTDRSAVGPMALPATPAERVADVSAAG
jgi:hypothetical protein